MLILLHPAATSLTRTWNTTRSFFRSTRISACRLGWFSLRRIRAVLNGSGSVTLADLMILQNHLSAAGSPIAASAVPEPSGLALLTLGAISLASGPDPKPDPDAIAQALLEGAREHGLHLLPWNERSRQLRDRAAFAVSFDSSIPPLDDQHLVARADEWLAPLLTGKRRFREFRLRRARSVDR